MLRLTRWWRQVVSDKGSARDLLKTARRVERRRVIKKQAQRATADPYYKAQYISAFVEAQSAAISHQHRVAEKAPGGSWLTLQPSAGASSSSSVGELRRLAQELEHRYESPSSEAPPTAVVTREGGAKDALLPLHAKRKPKAVPFGAWREVENDNVRGKRIRSADVVRHCVIREARTPPEMSPEALERVVPKDLPAVRQLLSWVDRVTPTDTAPKADTEEVCVRLFDTLEALQAAPTSHRGTRVLLYILQRFAHRVSWQVSLPLLQRSMEVIGASVKNDADVQDSEQLQSIVSSLVAVWAEAVRFARLPVEGSGPTKEDVAAVVKTATAIISSQPSSSSPRLLPVVAAPLLSVLTPGTAPEPAASADSNRGDEAIQFAQTFLVQRRYQRKQEEDEETRKTPGYLPAVAWAELIRTAFRFGADQSAIQSLVDDITDPSRVKHADRLLCNVHVWNAYLSCADCAHALTVYRDNLRHYGVRENAATTAALLASLARSGTAEHLDTALQLYTSLRAKEGRLVIGTCSVYIALMRVHTARSDLEALLRLAVDYEGFLVYFGVPLNLWQSVNGEQLYSSVSSITQRDGPAPFLAAFDHIVAESGQSIPPQAQCTLHRCVQQLMDANAASAKAASAAVADLSPEMLADLM